MDSKLKLRKVAFLLVLADAGHALPMPYEDEGLYNLTEAIIFHDSPANDECLTYMVMALIKEINVSLYSIDQSVEGETANKIRRWANFFIKENGLVEKMGHLESLIDSMVPDNVLKDIWSGLPSHLFHIAGENGCNF